MVRNLPVGTRLRILNLYPRQMNIYGDFGNLLVLRQRAGWRGISTEVTHFETDASLKQLRNTDIILGGGGQDSGQAAVQKDMQRIARPLRNLVSAGCPALLVCGSYQLFGNYFKTFEGDVVEGIGIFNLHTLGGPERMIGNTVVNSPDFGELIGYENHSGKTYLGAGLEPLGRVITGSGNNGLDGSEGVRLNNALGTYLHGPLLPKNPQVADFLLASALSRKLDRTIELPPLDNALTLQARAVAKSRPRYRLKLLSTLPFSKNPSHRSYHSRAVSSVAWLALWGTGLLGFLGLLGKLSDV
ncbi:MAG: glutamine amidotransferase [Coriobacteriales bacterium]|jgi:CobQ-like glutamine amidotransferase family enzyme|nr:glutamine amidotransferase [Coriobacteriales bacterium]